MLGTIRTSQKCPACGGRMLYDPRRHGCFCETHIDIAAAKGFYVQIGRHQKRFSRSLVMAERHLNFIRSQRDYNQYDPRDWQRTRPMSLGQLGRQWLDHKANTRPALTPTRMHELEVSVQRAVDFWGADRNIKTVSDEDLAQFYAHPHTFLNSDHRVLSEKSVFNLCTNLQAFFEWGCAIARIPAPRFHDLGYTYNETPTITVRQQIEIVDWIAANCPEPRIVFAIQALAKNARVRPGELCEVRWAHIDIFGDKGVIYVHKRKNRRKIGRRRKPEPKLLYLDADQIAYLKTQPWGDPDELFMVYTTERSGVKVGDAIHPKRLNYWFKKGAEAFGIETYLYAGTKHATTTGLGQYLTREQIRRGATGHATDDAFEHYYHDQVAEQLRAQKAVDKMHEDARRKLRAIK